MEFTPRSEIILQNRRKIIPEKLSSIPRVSQVAGALMPDACP